MPATRKEVFLFFVCSLLGYAGVCSYLVKQAPVIKPAPFTYCFEKCTSTTEYSIANVSEQYALERAIKSVFEEYRQDEIGYYIKCSKDHCALSIYVNTPSRLAPLLSAVNNRLSMSLKSDQGAPQTWLDSTIYLLFSRTLNAIHHPR